MTKIISSVHVFVCIFLVSAIQVLAVGIPPQLAELSDEALKVAGTNDHDDSTHFDSVMVELGQKVDASTFSSLLPDEGQLLQAKMVVVAYYRTQHAALYNKVMNQFYNITASTSFANAGGPRSPDVSPEYLTEKYRLIWEYLLLSPGRTFNSGERNRSYLNFAVWRPIDALRAIGSSKSLNVLSLAYEKSLRGSSDVDFATLGQLLDAVVSIGSISNNSEDAFIIFFHCYTLTEGRDAAFATKKAYKSVENFFLGRFNTVPKDIFSNWQSAARKYPRSYLNTRESGFIQSFLERR